MRVKIIFLCFSMATASINAVSEPVSAQATTPLAGKLALPSQQEAAQALIKILDMAAMRNSVTVKLGTCISAVDAEHAGQVACSVAVKIGAATSETQADFYRAGGSWVAQPSASQDKLPFPDPAL